MDDLLRQLMQAVVGDHAHAFACLLRDTPALATAALSAGALRSEPDPAAWFLAEIGLTLYAGDTALHVAAAAYSPAMCGELIAAGAEVAARNRRGCQPLHAAAKGSPGSQRWNPHAQAAVIRSLVAAGANPNAVNQDGATPLHRAVRTRCAEAVRTLLECGADASIRTKNGSTARHLALHTTGRSGAGSVEAKLEQRVILQLLPG